MIWDKYARLWMKLSVKLKRKDFPEYFKDENDQINDKLQIANKFNIFFTDIGKKTSKTD